MLLREDETPSVHYPSIPHLLRFSAKPFYCSIHFAVYREAVVSPPSKTLTKIITILFFRWLLRHRLIQRRDVFQVFLGVDA